MNKFRIRPARVLWIALGSGMTVAGAVADGSDHRFYVSPLGSYTLDDHDRGTKDGYGGAIAVGKRITDSLDLEILGTFTNYQGRGGNTDTRLYGVGGAANIYAFPSSPLLGGLYLRLAIQRGQGKDSPSLVSDYTTTLFDGGLGYNWTLTHSSFGPFAPGIALRVEALYRHDAHGRSELNASGGGAQYFQEAVFNVGFRIPLGGRATAAAPPPVEEAQVVPVEAPPAEAPPPPPPCEPPVPGQPINLDGCKTGDSFVLRGVNFNFDKATLTVNAKALLDPVADALLARPAIKVELDGHTDSKGSDAYNQKLSDRRAASVMQYMISRGVDASRLAAKGFGESMPVADNNTDEGRELNRRVELKITDDGSSAAPAPTEAAPAAEPAPAAVEGEAAPAADAAPAAEAAPAEAAPAEAAPAADAPAADAPAADAPAEAAPAAAEGEPAADATPPADAPAEAASAPADSAAPQ